MLTLKKTQGYLRIEPELSDMHEFNVELKMYFHSIASLCRVGAYTYKLHD